ncbi:hypothetical protein [Flavobacterium sp. N1994]|uniref:hypothetical protein n=1 Tax=Flavobacterium sp. N1994 TaxID=2986827 RepID=UPI002221D9C3|nr:hypothetical protein [Flavobacterium sp. N1994]
MTKELEDAFRKLKERGVHTFAVTVVSVNKEDGTCVVSDDDIEFPDVRLSAVIDGNNKKSYLFPKVGSDVLVSPIMEDLHKLYVEYYSELESLDYHFGEVQFKIDRDGFLLKKQNETLKKLVSDLLIGIKSMSFLVTTTGGNGNTTTLNNVATFNGIENRFNQFLKDS